MYNGESYTRVRQGEGGPSERWGGGSTKVANAVLAFAFLPGSILVARSDDPWHLRGNTIRPPSKCAPVLFRMISYFYCTMWKENRLNSRSGTKDTSLRVTM